MRDDLSEPQRREVVRQRREFCRAVGARYTDLIDHYIDPEPVCEIVLRLMEAEKERLHDQAA